MGSLIGGILLANLRHISNKTSTDSGLQEKGKEALILRITNT